MAEWIEEAKAIITNDKEWFQKYNGCIAGCSVLGILLHKDEDYYSSDNDVDSTIDLLWFTVSVSPEYYELVMNSLTDADQIFYCIYNAKDPKRILLRFVELGLDLQNTNMVARLLHSIATRLEYYKHKEKMDEIFDVILSFYFSHRPIESDKQLFCDIMLINSFSSFCRFPMSLLVSYDGGNMKISKDCLESGYIEKGVCRRCVALARIHQQYTIFKNKNTTS